MLNSPTLSIFQHVHAIPLRSPLISLRSKWRLTGFSRRFTPKNPIRLHKHSGQLPRWGAKNVLPLNLIALLPRIGPWRRAAPKAPDRVPRRGTTLRNCQRPICVNRFSVILKRPTGRSAEICLFEAVYPWPSACPFSKGRRILRDSNNPQRFHCMMRRTTILHFPPSSPNKKTNPCGFVF